MGSRSRRLTTAEWAEIVIAFERGEATVVELAEKYDVTRQAIAQRLKKQGVTHSSRLDEVMSDIADAAAEKRKELVKQAGTMKENYAQYFDVISRLTTKKIIEANKSGKLAMVNAEIITLKNAAATIARARQESWDVLDINSLLSEEDSLPELTISEYTHDEIDEIRKQQEDEFQMSLDEDEEDEDDDES